jgi:ubiquinol oxidase|tara:strand:- start:11521 stop:12135 length:615 start_codon:yes stop_codon:yes gene_type:complete
MKTPVNFSDKVAYRITMFLRWTADTFFKKRYGHRAVVLETIAGVPGMVAGMWNHLRSLRKMKPDDRGWIKTLLAEAENERMHLMIFIRIAKPNWFERWMIITAQFIFWHFYMFLYIFFPQCAHRMVGYFEEQACISYTEYLKEIDEGRTENIKAPKIAIDYYNLSQDATLRDVVIAVRKDEEGHRDVNHDMADQIRRNRHGLIH